MYFQSGWGSAFGFAPHSILFPDQQVHHMINPNSIPFDWVYSDTLQLSPDIFTKRSEKTQLFIRAFVKSTVFSPTSTDQMGKLLQLLQFMTRAFILKEGRYLKVIGDLERRVSKLSQIIKKMYDGENEIAANFNKRDRMVFKEEIYRCPICNKDFHAVEDIDSHITESHPSKMDDWFKIRGLDGRSRRAKSQRVRSKPLHDNMTHSEITIKLLEKLNDKIDKQKVEAERFHGLTTRELDRIEAMIEFPRNQSYVLENTREIKGAKKQKKKNKVTKKSNNVHEKFSSDDDYIRKSKSDKLNRTDLIIEHVGLFDKRELMIEHSGLKVDKKEKSEPNSPVVKSHRKKKGKQYEYDSYSSSDEYKEKKRKVKKRKKDTSSKHRSKSRTKSSSSSETYDDKKRKVSKSPEKRKGVKRDGEPKPKLYIPVEQQYEIALGSNKNVDYQTELEVLGDSTSEVQGLSSKGSASSDGYAFIKKTSVKPAITPGKKSRGVKLSGGIYLSRLVDKPVSVTPLSLGKNGTGSSVFSDDSSSNKSIGSLIKTTPMRPKNQKSTLAPLKTRTDVLATSPNQQSSPAMNDSLGSVPNRSLQVLSTPGESNHNEERNISGIASTPGQIFNASNIPLSKSREVSLYGIPLSSINSDGIQDDQNDNDEINNKTTNDNEEINQTKRDKPGRTAELDANEKLPKKDDSNENDSDEERIHNMSLNIGNDSINDSNGIQSDTQEDEPETNIKLGEIAKHRRKTKREQSHSIVDEFIFEGETAKSSLKPSGWTPIEMSAGDLEIQTSRLGNSAISFDIDAEFLSTNNHIGTN